MQQYYQKQQLPQKFQIPSKIHKNLQGHKGAIYSVKFNSNGEYIMSCSQDRNINLWNPHKGTLIKTFTGAHNYDIYDLCISQDNYKFGSAGGDKVAFLWDVSTGNILRKFEGHISKINTIVYSDDESVLITGSYDCKICFWDLKSHSYKPIDTIKICKDSVSKIVVDSHQVLVSSIDGKIRTFDIRMGILTTDDMKHPVHSFSLSNDKKTYAASCLDSNIRLLDRENGFVLNSYTGHNTSNYQSNVIFSFDDRFLIQGSEDGSIFYYDILSQEPKNTTKNHFKAVVALSLSPLRDTLVSGSYDYNISVWKIQESE
ncbi:mitogen-activated protein kinase organizer 1, putative [Ichthyophthirius multifiliis]|uniref:Mitogen-activated protein kinase organizer 1, putative n=1 Tax=Ichthyophthirius multifiliis TaxID=5932 RepID=G0R5J5_ICHMU|nr:mitogen-activated protein kinase organizer 1, putative [Ichthyophthirius multifiliis]EGR27255.1 mitogen-activated protein kinase organizer 1, putative [Ichthyophthirius multifiliis]|eukprot:XP_004024139.1 mitogen-activated protein kinase organizer 1, putative [Ichthyophthirius multifiliis]